MFCLTNFDISIYCPNLCTVRMAGIPCGISNFNFNFNFNFKSPGREVVRSSAGAGVVYPSFFGGHSRSIPQGMILDVQPLVKSLFCPIRRFPNGFFDSEASIPLKLDITFWGGVGRRGGGSKVCAQKDLNQGQIGQS